jgi:MFS family permease
VVAQATNLGVPYLLRSFALLLTLIVALVYMRDLGFTPAKRVSIRKNVQNILQTSIDKGFKNPPVRWVMLTAPFTAGVGFYGFYAMQPYLLQLFGDPHAYGIAGLAASIVAGAQILGGLTVPFIRRLFSRRTTLLMSAVGGSAIALAIIGFTHIFWVAVLFLIVWGLLSAAAMPIRQAYMNGLIPSEQRATVLSFDNLVGSAGAAVVQPALGKAADVWGYGASYVCAAFVQLLALPFLLLARGTKPSSDPIEPSAKA